MRFDDLHLWYLGEPATPRYVGALKLVSAGKGVSLHYGKEWLTPLHHEWVLISRWPKGAFLLRRTIKRYIFTTWTLEYRYFL